MQKLNGYCPEMDDFNNKKRILTISVEDKERIFHEVKKEIEKFKKGIRPRPLSHIWEDLFPDILSRKYLATIVKKRFPEMYDKIWAKGTISPTALSEEIEIEIKKRLDIEFAKAKSDSLNKISKDLGISFNALKIRVFDYLADLYGDDEELIKSKYHKKWKEPSSESVKIEQSKIIRDIVKSKGGELLSEYINKKTPVKVRCRCDHEFCIKPEHLKKGSWCTECFIEKKREKAARGLKGIIESKGGILFSEYLKAKEKVIVECKEGHRFSMTPDNIKQGYWCPSCSQGKWEAIICWYFEQIFSFITKKPISFIKTMICDKIDCSSFQIRPQKFKNISINLMHFDGYSEISLNNEIYKIAVEYNGIQHYKYPNWFHKGTPEDYKAFQSQQLRDDFKKWICNQTNIILIEFPYYVDDRMLHPIKIQGFIVKELRKRLKITIAKVPQYNHIYHF